MVLGDFGAEVIKVELPGSGDYARFAPNFFNQVNRNKKSMVLNLKDERGQKVFYRLAEKADVVVEGFRPGATARMGVDYQTLSEINPRIIYCSISGFGQEGPYRNRPGHDINYMSIGGALSLLKDRSGRPIEPGTELDDLTSGMTAVIAILLALLAREKTGRGQYLDIAMLDSAVVLTYSSAAIFFDRSKLPGLPLAQVNPAYRVYDTADGKHLSLGIVHEDWFWDELCDALGMDEWKGLNVFQRVERHHELAARLEEIFKQKTAAEWDEILSRYDVCYALVNDIPQAFSDPQVLHRKMKITVPTPESDLQMVGTPYKLSETPAAFKLPPPRLGEHTNAVLKDAGYSDAEIEELRNSGLLG
jgi:crotonobetainyl-CoA:carnitine CoA-transferase CaiB-like acyl-CoA transferase